MDKQNKTLVKEILKDLYLILGRPENYKKLSSEHQWEIDKSLGIFDWDGTSAWLKNHGFIHAAEKARLIEDYVAQIIEEKRNDTI